tara:strand:- start:1015 stop:1203 length:189 start_codon:yes stop_codon:yes gene_type:complete
MTRFKYTDEIADANVRAMLRLYQRENPKLDRAECIELMKKKERKFLGLDIKLKPNKKRKRRK